MGRFVKFCDVAYTKLDLERDVRFRIQRHQFITETPTERNEEAKSDFST